MKIRDRILLGAISGILGSIPGRLINAAEYRSGLVNARYAHMAASLIVGKKKAYTPEGEFLGAVLNQLLVATTGVAATYVLSLTGRDHAVLKGVGVTTFYWLMLYSLSSRLRDTTSSGDPAEAVLSLTDHFFFGAATGLIAAKLGDNSLFPDGQYIQ